MSNSDDLEETHAAKGPGGLNCKKFFIGGLPQEVDSAEIKLHFGQYGQVLDVRLTSNHLTGMTRGFGFVTMASEEAKNAIFEAKDHYIGGKLITLREMQENAGTEIDRKIFVGGLSPLINEDSLVSYFSKYGKVETARIASDENGKHKGFGFVTYSTEASCQKALASQSIHWVTPTQKVEIRKVENRRKQFAPPVAGQYGNQQRGMHPYQPQPAPIAFAGKLLGDGLKWNWRPAGSTYPAFEIDPYLYSVVSDNDGKIYLQPTPAEYERLFRQQATHPHLSPIGMSSSAPTGMMPGQSPVLIPPTAAAAHQERTPSAHFGVQFMPQQQQQQQYQEQQYHEQSSVSSNNPRFPSVHSQQRSSHRAAPY